MPRRRDPLWEYVEQEDGKVRCKFCDKTFSGSGITRMRHHLAKSELKEISPCDAVPGEVHKKALKAVQQLRKESGKKEFISDDRMAPSNSSSCSLTQLDSQSTQRNKKLKTDLSVMNFIYGNDLTSDLLEDPTFKEMCAAIADAGQGYEPPGFGMDETKILGDLKTEVDGYVQSIKQSWEKFGCTLLLKSYCIGGPWPRLLLLAACPEGIVYLDSMEHEWDKDTSGVLSVIDKIIPQNIIQIILGRRDFEWLGKDLQQKYPNIFITGGCQFLAIYKEYFSKFKNYFIEVHPIVNFFGKHVDVLHQISCCQLMLRKNFRKPFFSLHYYVSKEREIRSMVTSTKWRDMIQGDEQGVKVQNMIDDNQFWDTGKKLFRVIECAAKIMMMMKGNRSTLGYIYDAFIRLEETVKQSFKENSEIVSSMLDNIIPYIFEINKMHKAAAYLNPHLYYNGNVKRDNKVQTSLNDVIQKMISSEADKKDIDVQLENYYCRDPTIFSPEAVGSLHVLHPRIWWERWGGNAETLQTLAIKLLSQPCINPLYHTDWRTLLRDNFHYDQRNELSLDVRFNMLLMDMCSKMKVDESPIDFEKIGEQQVADHIEALLFYGYKVTFGRDEMRILSSD